MTALSDAVDLAIQGLWSRIGSEKEAALVAVGGYGRRQLSPASDVDLMVLHRGQSDVAPAAKELFYGLWDAGMQVGHSVRTPKEALRLARDDLDAETAFLDARLVAGDLRVWEKFQDVALGQSRRSPRAFLDRLRTATCTRRGRAGDASSGREPHLKDGRGGLRDLHTIGWVAKVCGTEGLDFDWEALDRAEELLLRVRNSLHFLTGRRSDVLLVQLQPEIAASLARLGGTAADGGAAAADGGAAAADSLARGEGEAPEEAVMRQLYESCRAVGFCLDCILDSRYAEAAAASWSPRLERDGRWTAQSRAAFLQILAAGDRGRPAFQSLEQSGALLLALPEWEGIRCLPQRNAYHRHAVDVHVFETVAALAHLASRSDAASRPGGEPGPGEPPEASHSRPGPDKKRSERPRRQPEGPDIGWEDLPSRVAVDAAADWKALLLAALLHDIGKGTPQDHSVRGELLAREAVKRMGLEQIEAEDVVWLVRHHLLLSNTAVRRDIEDESLILELAQAIGSSQRLRMLYLLSFADGMATGPQAWSPWKAGLVSVLFLTLFRVLEQGEAASGDASDLSRLRAADLRLALAGFPTDAVERHLSAMPTAWLVSQSPVTLIKQSELMLEGAGAHEVRMHITLLEPRIWEITVVARDRPGLFSKVSGTVALHGLNVLAAQAFTRDDGLALEVFRVTGPEGRFDGLSEDVRKVLMGRISLDVRLEAKRRDYAARFAKAKRQPPRVVVDNQVSACFTVIEVHATDRIGLLYTITRALSDLELDIHLARVATYGDDVVDVFYVRDLEGEKVTDPEHLREIERTILHRLSLRPSAEM